MDTSPALADDPLDLFSGTSLASYDVITGLVGEYQSLAKKIDHIAGIMSPELRAALSYFIEGNGDKDSRSVDVDRLLRKKGAVAALDAAFWQRAMQMTDIMDIMPQARRDTWYESIRERKCPHFEEQVVRDTFADLMAMRVKFLAERVDGIFSGLSGEHVTNSSAAFGKRMIISGVTGMYDYQKTGLINDLRCVVAKLMRRDEPKHNASAGLIRSLKGNYGEWVPVDGGALKVRLYMKGTAHLEVHPDMAWRLNAILHTLHPRAIPPEHRTKPRRQVKEVAMLNRLLPFAVVEVLADLDDASRLVETGDWRQTHRRQNIPMAVALSYRDADKAVMLQVRQVLESIGGVETSYGWQFDYPPRPVIQQIVALGAVPDEKAHQFYPTPPEVAAACIELAQIGGSHSCLEPSAGLGGLSDLMPKDRTLCIEVAPLRCEVLRSKGYTAVAADFLQWAEANKLRRPFDRIVMNPPFDQGRWRAHLEAAASLLAEDGRLVCVLPSSAKGKELLDGFLLEWPQTFENAFAGTSQPVAILVATRLKRRSR